MVNSTRRLVVLALALVACERKSDGTMRLVDRTAPLDERKPTAGLTLFYTDFDRKHIEVREIDKMGRHAVDSNQVFFDALPVHQMIKGPNGWHERVVEIDPDGDPISYEEFYPFGGTSFRSGEPEKRYRYTGKEHDEETGDDGGHERPPGSEQHPGG